MIRRLPRAQTVTLYSDQEESPDLASPGEYAMRFVNSGYGWRSDRTLPIPGFRTFSQVEENIGAFDFGPLTSEQMEQIETLLERAPAQKD